MVVEGYDYLATLNEFVGRYNANAVALGKFWRKLSGGSPNIFLDTVAEAAWVLHLSRTTVTSAALQQMGRRSVELE